jgi:hypothetical protein
MISEEEKQQRRGFVEEAIYSIGLEGFTLDAESRLEYEPYINGEATLDQVTEKLHKRLGIGHGHAENN